MASARSPLGTEAQPASPPASSGQATPGPDNSTGLAPTLFTRFPWAKPAATFLVVIASFLLVKKLAGFIPSAALGRLILLIFFLAVSVGVFKAYGEHMSANYFSLKQKMQALLEVANRREMPETGPSPLPVPLKDASSP